ASFMPWRKTARCRCHCSRPSGLSALACASIASAYRGWSTAETSNRARLQSASQGWRAYIVNMDPEIEGRTMKYMLLIYMGEQAMNDTERQQCYVDSTQLCHDLNASGQYVAANPLHPVATATSVRVRDGKRLVTDGPFAETREQLGGYFMIEAKDLDEAIG